MFFLFTTQDGCSHIAEENEKDGSFTLKATDMNNNNSVMTLGDVLSSKKFYEIVESDKEVYQAELVAGFENHKMSAQVYKTSSGRYQVVSNGIIRHPNIDADGAIRAISFYSNS